MRVVVVRPALLFVLAAAIASPIFAVNLVTNPSFAGDTTGWVTAGSTTFDAANDATGTPGSGSAKSTFVASGSSTLLSLSQCIAAGPGSYTLGGKVLIPSGQPVGGSGLITVSFFSGPDCITGFLSFASLSTSTTGSFQTLSGPIVAPAGTAHIWITGQNNASAAGTHIVNFDDFVLDNGVSLAVPALGRFGLLALMAALAAIALFILRR
jgi:hypothetical protein